MKHFLREFGNGAIRGLGILTVLLMGFALTFIAAQQIRVFESGRIVSASDINANFTNLKTGITDVNAKQTALETTFNAQVNLKPPVGSIIAWHKSAAGVPALPAGWMECDGSTVTDVDSPLNGLALPNLNGGTRFLRGGSVSGVMQNATKVLSIAEIGLGNDLFVGAVGGTPIFPEDVDAWVDEGTAGRRRVATSPPGLNPHRNDSYRVRVINMSVVWIMRIK